MTRTEQMGFVRLAADGGYLYNGEIVATVVCAPVGADLSPWQEITTAAGDAIKVEQAAARVAALAQAQAEMASPADAADGAAATEAAPAGNE